jgi:hypothetical protein
MWMTTAEGTDCNVLEALDRVPSTTNAHLHFLPLWCFTVPDAPRVSDFRQNIFRFQMSNLWLGIPQPGKGIASLKKQNFSTHSLLS